MSDLEDHEQSESWKLLYERLRTRLLDFGTEDYRAAADCWIDDDNIGTRQQKIYVRNLSFLRPEVVTSLQSILQEFPGWEIMIAVSRQVRGDHWPDMGLIIRAHEIIDGLQRAYFPTEFQSLAYEGSRRGTDRD